MAIRRQGFQWEVADLGNIPPKQLDLLEKTPQSVFYSKIGTATIKNRLRTKANEFVVLQYFGSTPGLWGLETIGSQEAMSILLLEPHHIFWTQMAAPQ